MKSTRKFGELSPEELVLFNSLYLSRYSIFFMIAYRTTKNRQMAEDVVQESFVKACSNFQEIKEEEHFLRWMAVTTTNTSIDFLRKNKKFYFLEDFSTVSENLASSDYLPEQAALNSEVKNVLLKVVQSQKPKYTAILIHRYYNELSYAEISTMLGECEATLRSRCHRAVKLMREALQELDQQYILTEGDLYDFFKMER